MKSKLDIRVDELLDEYNEAYGKPYPLGIFSRLSLEELADDIERCIKSGKPKEEPKYIEGMIY